VIIVPTLDELARDPARAVGLPVETLAALVVKHAAVGSALGAALLLSRSSKPQPAESDPDDELLKPDEAAALLHRKPRWIYRNAHRLPFVRRLSPKSLLCSKKGLDRWLAAQKP
jgi:hypothetical protein